MAISPPEPPENVVRAVRTGVLRSLLARDGPPVVGRLGFDTEPVDPELTSLVAPIESFVLDVPRSAGRASAVPLSAARPTGWRFVVRHREVPLAVGETVVYGGGPTFAALEPQSVARLTIAAIDRVVDVLGSVEDAYAVRFLRIPSVGLNALWGHGPDDLFVPIAGARRDIPGLRGRGLIGVGALFDLVDRLATPDDAVDVDPDWFDDGFGLDRGDDDGPLGG